MEFLCISDWVAQNWLSESDSPLVSYFKDHEIRERISMADVVTHALLSKVKFGSINTKPVIDEYILRQEEILEPRRLFMPMPVYPFELKRKGVEGSVAIHIRINELGTVARIAVKSSSHTEFEDPALKAVLQSIYRPAWSEGKPIAVEKIQRITFRLEGIGTKALQSNGKRTPLLDHHSNGLGRDPAERDVGVRLRAEGSYPAGRWHAVSGGSNFAKATSDRSADRAGSGLCLLHVSFPF